MDFIEMDGSAAMELIGHLEAVREDLLSVFNALNVPASELTGAPSSAAAIRVQHDVAMQRLRGW